jgi:hypothetical protein
MDKQKIIYALKRALVCISQHSPENCAAHIFFRQHSPENCAGCRKDVALIVNTIVKLVKEDYDSKKTKP